MGEGELREKLAEGIARGRPVDLGTEDEPTEVESGLLADALFAAGVPHPRGLHLLHARITGPLDLRDLRFDAALHFAGCTFAGCTFAGSVSLWRAALASLTLTSCRIDDGEDAGDLDAMEMATTHSLVLAGTVITGAVVLTLARVGGAVLLTPGTEIRNRRHSIEGDGLSATGSLIVQGTLLGGARLNGATIGGQLFVTQGTTIGAAPTGYSIEADDLTTAGGLFIESTGTTTLHGSLRLNGATIGGQLGIRGGATIGTGPRGDSLDADHLTTGSSLFIQGTTLHGAARLNGATIGGQLNIGDGATIGTDHESRSLNADRLTTTGSLFIEGTDTSLQGNARLNGATIGGQLGIRGGAAIGTGARGESLHCEDLTTASALVIEGATLHGAACLNGATIGGQLSIHRASIGADRGWSLQLDSGSSSQVLIEDASIAGGLDLRRASIGQFLGIDDGTDLNGQGHPVSIALEGADVARARWRVAASPGLVDLRDCRIAVLDDTPAFWGLGSPGRRAWLLAGSTVERLAGAPDFPAQQRRDWLRHSAGPDGRDAPADRGTYRMVARAQVNGGEDDDAVETLRAMRRAHDPKWLRRLLLPIGQGYKPHWAAGGLLAVLIATFALSFVGDHTDAFVATGELSPKDAREVELLHSQECKPDRYPCLRPIVYAVDTMVPGLDLGEASRWSPATTRDGVPSWPDTLRYLLAFLRLIGWALGALFVIGMLNVIVEQRRTE